MLTPPTLSGDVDAEGRLSGAVDFRILKLRVGLSCSCTSVFKCHTSRMESVCPLPARTRTRGKVLKPEARPLRPTH